MTAQVRTRQRRNVVRTVSILAVCAAGLWSAAAEESNRAALNLLVAHKDQDLSCLYTGESGEGSLPERYVEKLAESNIVMVRYLLPNLIQKIIWPEQTCEVVLIGTRVVVPNAHRSLQRAVEQHVDLGEMILGAQIAAQIGAKKGDQVTLKGCLFTVEGIHPRRENIDDNTVWLSLPDAQELLDQRGRISLIQVLECRCAWADIDIVKSELKTLLPDTQIVVFGEERKK